MNEDTSRIHRVSGGAIDEAIDRAVRDIMSAEPPTGLRRRVLARLERPQRSSLLPRLAFATAGVAAIALAVVLLRPSPLPPDDSRSTVSRDVRLTPEPMAPPAAAPVSAVPAPQIARRTGPTTTRIAMPRIGNVFGERETRVTAASATVDDVVFPPAEPSRPQPEVTQPAGIPLSEITIVPLMVEQIRVAPLAVRR